MDTTIYLTQAAYDALGVVGVSATIEYVIVPGDDPTVMYGEPSPEAQALADHYAWLAFNEGKAVLG